MPREIGNYSVLRKRYGEESPDSIEQGAHCKMGRVTASLEQQRRTEVMLG